MLNLSRRAWVEIDLGALVRNARRIQERAGVPLLPMVKADAYGLGAVQVARALESLDPWGFGIATIAEGEELRRAGIERRIVIFTPLLVDDLDAAERWEITPVLNRRELIDRWGPTRLPWHLGVDTGMSRAGIRWDEVDSLRDLIRDHPPEGIASHFHSAELDDASRDEQERRFDDVLASLPVRPRIVHIENGAAVEHRAPSTRSVVRPGIFMYGVGSGHDAAIVPEQVVAVRARVVELRTVDRGETVSYDATWKASGKRSIATLSIGYADGYRRALGNRGSVLIGGRSAPVVGHVTMDMTMVDVTGIPCGIGDVATLIGRDGGGLLTAETVAATAEMSPYELLTGLRGRLPRRYLETDATPMTEEGASQ